MTMTRRQAGAGLAATSALAARGIAAPPRPRALVFGHRGAPAWYPEHTIASYNRALSDGADVIEPDLVPTRDGVLVARHENNIAETTDVSARPEFAARRTTKVIDGTSQTGWFTEDFTLAELKTLRAKERLGTLRPESAMLDGQFQILTFEEVVDFVTPEINAHGHRIGLAPELKHPTYFKALGFDVEAMLLTQIARITSLQTAPLVIQCFEPTTLRSLHQALKGQPNVELLQLVDSDAARPADAVASGSPLTNGAMLAPRGLADVARYARWIAPSSRRLIPELPDGSLGKPTSLIADAHAAGLKVCTWTFRPENRFQPRGLWQGPDPATRNEAGSVKEIRAYLAAGIDGFFTDDPALGRLAVDGRRARR